MTDSMCDKVKCVQIFPRTWSDDCMFYKYCIA